MTVVETEEFVKVEREENRNEKRNRNQGLGTARKIVAARTPARGLYHRAELIE